MSVPSLNEPVDQAHRDSVQAVRWVNEVFQEAKERAARWEPRPFRL